MVGGRTGSESIRQPSSAQHPAVTANNVTGHASATRTVIYFLKNKTNLSLSFGREVGKEGMSTGGASRICLRSTLGLGEKMSKIQSI